MTDPVEEYMTVHNYEPWVYEGENIILWRSPTNPDMTMDQARYLYISSLEARKSEACHRERKFALDRQIAAVKRGVKSNDRTKPAAIKQDASVPEARAVLMCPNDTTVTIEGDLDIVKQIISQMDGQIIKFKTAATNV